jgi:hypothetical protein
MTFASLTSSHIYFFYAVEHPGGGYLCKFTVDEEAEDPKLQPLIRGSDQRPKVYTSEAELRAKAPNDLQVFMNKAARRLGTKSPEDFYKRQVQEINEQESLA